MFIVADSDWAGDRDNRHSITGFVVFFLGVPIVWRSRAQKAVALSSAEAEYYAMSEAAKEIRFMVQLLESMGITVKKPIIVHADNIGAIFLSENASATSRTRHIDARYHFIREFIAEGFLKIVFVKTKENKSDIFTKNVSSEIYDSHVQDYVMGRSEIAGIGLVASEEGCWWLPDKEGIYESSHVYLSGGSESLIRVLRSNTSIVDTCTRHGRVVNTGTSTSSLIDNSCDDTEYSIGNGCHSSVSINNMTREMTRSLPRGNGG